MSPVNVDLPGGDAGRPGPLGSSDAFWSSRTQWGAILAGAFAGFAACILMITLGAALGITAGAIGVANVEAVNAETAEKTATMLSIGATVWFLLTALVTGLVGGWVLNATSRRDRPYSSFVFGGITWAVGLCLITALAAPGIGGMFSGMGGGAAGVAHVASNRPELISPLLPKATREEAAPAPTQPSESQARPAEGAKAPLPMTDEEKATARTAAEKATTAAAGAAWVLLGAQLISIAATMFAAGLNRHTGTRVVTEIRPRPI